MLSPKTIAAMESRCRHSLSGISQTPMTKYYGLTQQSDSTLSLSMLAKESHVSCQGGQGRLSSQQLW
jgi:hypothetical protein